MAPRKSERILNLTICLLAATRFLTREQIRDTVEGYAGLSDAAFERTFERDKDELRGLGIPVETGSNSTYFDDEIGYRIPRANFELPPIEFTADEAAVVSMAGRVWQEAHLASSSQVALAKLRAAGLSTDDDRLALVAPASTARVAAFEPLWEALVQGRRVSFGYRRPRAVRGARRLVEPWGIVSHKGNWYLIGHDVDRDAARMFKIARIIDDPVPVGAPGEVVVPPDLDLRELARRLEPSQPSGRALIAVRSGYAPLLTRHAESAEAPGVAIPAGFEVFALRYPPTGSFAAELAGHGPDVIVIEPAELREEVRAHLRALIGAEQ